MKKHLKLILAVLLVLSLFGCGAAKKSENNPATTATSKTVAKKVVSTPPVIAPEVQQALDSLQPAPTSYCISYLVKGNSDAYELNIGATDIQQYGMSHDKFIEYCTDGSNGKDGVDYDTGYGTMRMMNFCLGNTKGVFCDSNEKYAGTTVCVDYPDSCTKLHSLIDKVKLTSYPLNNLSYYTLEPAQLPIGNFPDAKCFKIESLTPEQSKEAGLTEEDIEYNTHHLCYHPQYKQLIYYKGLGTEITVSNYLTPAPAEKFEVPVPVGIKTWEEIKAEIDGIVPR